VEFIFEYRFSRLVKWLYCSIAIWLFNDITI